MIKFYKNSILNNDFFIKKNSKYKLKKRLDVWVWVIQHN